MDSMDLDILKLLVRDARLGSQGVARRLGIDEERARQRIQALEGAGVIRGYGAVVDREQLEEQTISALIEVKVQPERNRGFDAIAEQLYAFEEVKSCYLMSGDYDLMLIVEGKDVKAVSKFVAERLSILDNVRSCATHFILKRYKSEGIIFEKRPADRRMVVSL